ncbi:MAG: hypothetical protein K2J81_03685 [Treponemataceae bacterium]|nr:hypothetical protein [Treponemataceae bacterium]
MTNLFKLINSECQFSEELINYGITQLRKADLQRKGLYYQAFANLSMGFERLLKLIIILDNYHTNNELFTQNQLRKLGHDLSHLYEQSIAIGNKHKIEKQYSENNDIYDKIMTVLSDFANTGNDNRYFNLNYISEVNLPGFVLPKDATYKWHEQIDGYIYENKVSPRHKTKIEQQSIMLGTLLDTYAMLAFNSETNNDVNNGIDFCLNKNRQLACQPYRVLFVAQIVRYLSKILSKLAYKLRSTDNQNIPCLNEYFVIYQYNDNSYLLRKRNFIK